MFVINLHCHKMREKRSLQKKRLNKNKQNKMINHWTVSGIFPSSELLFHTCTIVLVSKSLKNLPMLLVHASIFWQISCYLLIRAPSTYSQNFADIWSHIYLQFCYSIYCFYMYLCFYDYCSFKFNSIIVVPCIVIFNSTLRWTDTP